MELAATLIALTLAAGQSASGETFGLRPTGAFDPVPVVASPFGAVITLLGEYPSLAIGPLLDNHQTDIGAVMRESLETEAKTLALYRELLRCAEGRSVILEEYARQMVYAEELHASEVDKMLRKPGEVAAFRPT